MWSFVLLLIFHLRNGLVCPISISFFRYSVPMCLDYFAKDTNLFCQNPSTKLIRPSIRWKLFLLGQKELMRKNKHKREQKKPKPNEDEKPVVVFCLSIPHSFCMVWQKFGLAFVLNTVISTFQLINLSTFQPWKFLNIIS